VKQPTTAQVQQWLAELSQPTSVMEGGETIREMAERTGRDAHSVAKYLKALLPMGMVQVGKAKRLSIAGYERKITVFRLKEPTHGPKQRKAAQRG
jgi:predicted transcriptional regulator